MKSIFLGFANNFVMVPKALVQPLHLVLSAHYYKGVEQPNTENWGASISLSLCISHVHSLYLCMYLCVLHTCLVPIETGKVR